MKLAIATLIATAAIGANAQTFVDHARVRSVDPQYESVNVPRQECNTQRVNEVHRVGTEPNYGGAVVGGVAGALLGHQVGGGHGKEAATAVGAVVGAFTGDRLANGDRPQQYVEVPRDVTSCRTVADVQTRIAGYRVNYDYRGQHYTTMMQRDPGPDLQVRVSVEPIAP
jgi:uncharacterized protein YcfJ